MGNLVLLSGWQAATEYEMDEVRFLSVFFSVGFDLTHDSDVPSVFVGFDMTLGSDLQTFFCWI